MERFNWMKRLQDLCEHFAGVFVTDVTGSLDQALEGRTREKVAVAVPVAHRLVEVPLLGLSFPSGTCQWMLLRENVAEESRSISSLPTKVSKKARAGPVKESRGVMVATSSFISSVALQMFLFRTPSNMPGRIDAILATAGWTGGLIGEDDEDGSESDNP
ncbi:uncharacterized protein BKCO1_5900037 [Diplodia corticola]|uniref:Uncharacterized protein n=1 Tax=Diplodia corticola TaxID=236234 RepID=A0A1J9QQ19_9PEZI|nr:uncharacterized protein BKCO1_5900037 [Diplodia corticola]OJD30560.1 hypothetical protein BKCO1_5900037 [Diplodia corticola]